MGAGRELGRLGLAPGFPLSGFPLPGSLELNSWVSPNAWTMCPQSWHLESKGSRAGDTQVLVSSVQRAEQLGTIFLGELSYFTSLKLAVVGGIFSTQTRSCEVVILHPGLSIATPNKPQSLVDVGRGANTLKL